VGTPLLYAGRGAELIVLGYQCHHRAWVTGTAQQCTRRRLGHAKGWSHQHPPRHPRIADRGDHHGTEGVTDQPHREVPVAVGHLVEGCQHVEAFADTTVVAAW
jgi:hypothetical protein